MTVREMDRWHAARLPIKQLTRRCIRSGPGQINRVPTTKVLVSLFTHEMCAMKCSSLILFWLGKPVLDRDFHAYTLELSNQKGVE